MSATEVARVLLPRLRRWTPASWTVPAAAPPPAGTRWSRPAGSSSGGRVTRADVVAGVVQRLADAGAELEGRPRREVPRLADTVLADQLAVVVDDLLRTGAPAAERAVAEELTALRAAVGLR